MRIFRSEFAQSYDTYSFGYTLYAEKERGDILSNVYEKGFLPYSGSPSSKNIFYMARSLRLPLRSFELSSENKRIIKKLDGTLSRKEFTPTDLAKDAIALQFCIKYFSERHGSKTMPKERLTHILKSEILSTVTKYSKDSLPVAYVFEARDEKIAHYWFSFYDLSYLEQSLGMYLLIDAAREAKMRGQEYLYLGTAYSEKALYKTNFEGLEYWNGNSWSKDIAALKKRMRSDSERTVSLSDEWKNNFTMF